MLLAEVSMCVQGDEGCWTASLFTYWPTDAPMWSGTCLIQAACMTHLLMEHPSLNCKPVECVVRQLCIDGWDAQKIEASMIGAFPMRHTQWEWSYRRFLARRGD